MDSLNAPGFRPERREDFNLKTRHGRSPGCLGLKGGEIVAVWQTWREVFDSETAAMAGSR